MPVERKWACNIFVGKGVKVVYGVDDFGSNGGYLPADSIAVRLDRGAYAQWSAIGKMSDPATTASAVREAVKGHAVVAVWKSENGDHGHVALILPRDSVYSGADKRYYPCAAQFSLGSESSSWIGRGLRFAFDKDKVARVLLYARSDKPDAAWKAEACLDWTPKPN
jgi:hypothetical protein